MASTAIRFQIRRAHGTIPFYFVILARNGQVLMTSELYRRKPSARKAIYALIDGITDLVSPYVIEDKT